MVPAASDARERRDNSGCLSFDTLLLANPDLNTDLAWLVERVCQNKQPWVVVAATALTAWQQRDPAGWVRVARCERRCCRAYLRRRPGVSDGPVGFFGLRNECVCANEVCRGRGGVFRGAREDGG